MFGPALAYDDVTDNVLENAMFFMYATMTDALADSNRLPVYDEIGLPITVLKSGSTGAIPRWQAQVRVGYVRSGDSIQSVYSGEGLERYLKNLEGRIALAESALASGTGITDDGILNSDDYDFEVDPSRPNGLLLYSDQDMGDDIEIVVDPTRQFSLLLYER